MDSPQIDIVRGLAPGLDLRADGDAAGGGMPTMVGHFSRFNEWYEIHSYWEGDFIERIVAGAFEESFAMHWDDSDPHRTKVQFQHGWDSSVGMRLLGKLSELREDGVGGYYACPLFDTSYNADLVPGLEAGEYGASFRFRVLAEEWDEEPGIAAHNPKGLPERSITKARVFELGPVAFGASPTATAGLRCLTDAYYEAMRTSAPQAFADACRAAGRDAPGEPSTRPAAPTVTGRAKAAGDRDLKALPDAVLERGLDLGVVTTRRRGQELVEARSTLPELTVEHTDDGKVTVEGWVAVYDEPRAVAGDDGWTEIWSPNACARCVGGKPDVRLTLNGDGAPIARSKAGSLQLTSDDYGLHIRATLDSSTPRGNDAVLAIQRGDAVEVEVAFDVTKQRWDGDHARRQVEEVRLHDMALRTSGSPAAARAVEELNSRDLVEAAEPDGDHMSLDLARAIRDRHRA